MARTFPALPGTSVAADIAALATRTDSLNDSFADTTEPTEDVGDGKTFYDSSTAVRALFVRRNGTFTWVGKFVPCDVDYQDQNTSTIYYQSLHFRTDNEAADPTPAAGNIGLFIIHTGLSKFKGIVSATILETFVSASSVDLIPTELPLSAWQDHTTAPAAGTKGIAVGKLFSSTAQKLVAQVRVPTGYLDSLDLKLRLFTLLDAAETADDDEEWTCELVSLQPDNGETALGAVTTTAVAAANRATGKVDEGDLGITDITLDYDDADNPIHKGDLLILRISRTSVGGAGKVANCLFLGAQLLSPFGDRLTTV